MKWTVMLRSLPLIRPLATLGANLPERKVETPGSRREPTGIKLQPQKLGSLRRRDGCGRIQWRRHPSCRRRSEPGVAGHDQQKCEDDTSGQYTRETGPATHQDERIRISAGKIPVGPPEIFHGPLASTCEKRMCPWDNGGLGLQVRLPQSVRYTSRKHWEALRRSRSMRVILTVFAIFSSGDTVLAFLRNGTSLNWSDFRAFLNRMPGTPLVWFLGLSSLTLIALLIAMFYETQQIVQQHIDQQESDARDLKADHEREISLLRTAYAGELQAVEAALRTQEQEDQQRRNRQEIVNQLAALCVKGGALLERVPANTSQGDTIVATWNKEVSRWHDEVVRFLSDKCQAQARNRFADMANLYDVSYPNIHQKAWNCLSALKRYLSNLSTIIEQPDIYIAEIIQHTAQPQYSRSVQQTLEVPTPVDRRPLPSPE
jgi:hypothetical protein